MSPGDRAQAAVPYLQQLMLDREVQDAVRRTGVAARQMYARGRGKNAAQLAKDKKLRRRAEEVAAAAWEVWTAIDTTPSRRRGRGGRLGRRLGLLVLGGAAVFVSTNAEARKTILRRVAPQDGQPASSTPDQPAQSSGVPG